MRNRITGFLTMLAVVLLTALPARAQTIITNTTLASAVTTATGTSLTVTVASATGFAVGNFMWVDREAMLINAVTGTAITVQRGQLASFQQTHLNGATVLTGVPSFFIGTDPQGSCVRSNQQYLPLVNTISGNIWSCDNNLHWLGTNQQILVYNSIQLR